jgi:hypothetical protein
MHRALPWLATAALLVTMPSCAARRSPAADRPDSPGRTTLTVQNDHFLDHTIYLLRGTERIRLGVARGLTQSDMTIPSVYVFGVSSLQFLADPIGSQATAVTQTVTVSAGDSVVLIIRGR